MEKMSFSCCSRRSALIFIVGLVAGGALVYLIVKETVPAVPAPALMETPHAGARVPAARPPIVVQVLTTCPGMSAQSVEKAITRRMERWVNQVPGVGRIESKSIVGASLVTIYFRDDVDPNTALTTTSSIALAVLPFCPPSTLPPVVVPANESGPREIDELLKTLAEPGASAQERSLKKEGKR
jgi:hypothetical protein